MVSQDLSITIGLRQIEGLIRQDRNDEARQRIQQMMEQHRGNPMLLVLSGLVDVNLGRYAEAIESFELVLCTTEDPVLCQKAHDQLSLIHLKHTRNAVDFARHELQRIGYMVRPFVNSRQEYLSSLVGVALALIALGEEVQGRNILMSLRQELAKQSDTSSDATAAVSAVSDVSFQIIIPLIVAPHLVPLDERRVLQLSLPVVRSLFEGLAVVYRHLISDGRSYWTGADILASILGRLCAKLPEATILDCGCGDGELARCLQPVQKQRQESETKSLRLIGLDLCDAMIELAQRDGLYDRAVRVDVHEAIRRRSFDAVTVLVAAGLVNYLPDVALWLREAIRTIRPGGYLLFDALLAEPRVQGQQSSIRPIPGWRLTLDEDELTRQIESLGLRVIDQIDGLDDQGAAAMSKTGDEVVVGYGGHQQRLRRRVWVLRLPGVLSSPVPKEDEDLGIVFSRHGS